MYFFQEGRVTLSQPDGRGAPDVGWGTTPASRAGPWFAEMDWPRGVSGRL